MRPRKWVLFVALSLFLVGVSLLYLKRRIENDRKLEALFTEVISPGIGINVTVETIRIGFFSIYLKNVHASIPLKSVTVLIPSIKIGLSFSKLIASHGNLPLSINRIILLKPSVTFSLEEKKSKPPIISGDTYPLSGPPDPHFSESALSIMTIKNGSIILGDVNGIAIAAATNISGAIVVKPHGTEITIAGELGSRKKNIFLRSQLSFYNKKHFLSVRINNAHIDKPIAFKNVTVETGILDGVVECTFNDNLIPDSTEIHGRLNLSGSTLSSSVNTFGKIDSVTTGIIFSGNLCRFSSLTAKYRGINITSRGEWDFHKKQPATAFLTLSNIIPDSLHGSIPDNLSEHLNSIGTVTMQLQWTDGAPALLSANVAQLQVGKTDLKPFTAYARISSEAIIVDSLVVGTSFLHAHISGNCAYAKENNPLDFSFNISVDSLPPGLDLSGTIQAFGSISGTATTPEISGRITGENITYKNITLKTVELIATITGQHCSFTSIDNTPTAAFNVAGTVDTIFSDSRSAFFSVAIKSDPIKELFKRISPVTAIDSAYITIAGSGDIQRSDATIGLFIKSKAVSGTITTALHFSDSGTKGISWKMTSDNLYLNNHPAPVFGYGIIAHHMVTIESISLLNGISGTGTIHYGVTPPQVNVELDYHKKISDCMEYLSLNPNLIDRGTISGNTVFWGNTDSLLSRSVIRCVNICKGDITGITAETIVTTSRETLKVLPFSFKRGSMSILEFDTASYNFSNDHFSFQSCVNNLTPYSFFGNNHTLSSGINANVSGTITTSDSGFPLHFSLGSPFLKIGTISLDSIRCNGCINATGISVSSVDFSDGPRTKGRAIARIPFQILGNNASDHDTVKGTLKLTGDLLATIEKNIRSPIGGSGKGFAAIDFLTSGGVWKFSKGLIKIPAGVLRVHPFVPDEVKNYQCIVTIDSNGLVHTTMSGTIKKQPISIFSEHTIPDTYEPIVIGPLNFGILHTVTPEKGVPLYLPGFMAINERGTIEFAGKKPFNDFAISGPFDKLKITGIWLLRDMEFTFPLLPNPDTVLHFNPFQYINWELDIKPGNRKLMYFRDISGKKNRIMRFIEGFLDPGSIIKLHGRELDKTFQITGIIRSYKGNVYYGRTFNRNFDVGVEFIPQKVHKNGSYDNSPLLWGSAEALSDSSRYKRIKLTCMIHDPITGSTLEKGRLISSTSPNISFHLSSDFDELPGKSERDFYQQAGLTFTSIGSAGGAVSDFGEQIFHSYLLQNWERRIAKKLGLDLINIETSIVSNYFNKLYERQFDDLLADGDYLALANVGVTIGRYFFRDYFLVKARSELIPVNMMLTPEYSVGFEFQPSRFVLMDLNYGFHKTDNVFQHNPLLVLQLRLPITSLRRNLNF